MMSTHRHTVGIARCGLSARSRSARAGTAYQCGCMQSWMGTGLRRLGRLTLALMTCLPAGALRGHLGAAGLGLPGHKQHVSLP